jgi:hypothetical protein
MSGATDHFTFDGRVVPAAAFPWALEAYPELLRGMVELLGRRAAVRTILDWRRGRRAVSLWALDVLQEALKSVSNVKTNQSGNSKGKNHSVAGQYTFTNPGERGRTREKVTK